MVLTQHTLYTKMPKTHTHSFNFYEIINYVYVNITPSTGKFAVNTSKPNQFYVTFM